MGKVYVFMANGFEDIEALAPLDILRRGGVDVVTVSITGTEFVESAHGVTMKADTTFEEAGDFADADVLMLPGGMPGAANLNDHEGVCQALLQQNAKGKRIGAICAAPMVLGNLGILQGHRATCYPGFEQFLDGAEYTADLFTVSGNITTGEGPAAALPYGYELLRQLKGEEIVAQLEEGMRYCHLLNK
ncbi:MAG: DJ-1/PfpI family protein [Prevotella sp.]|jgi:4-methyl-5(b-hydroxyethyl)-thiazole monophosphate biosynthesis|nr:DJ-1/PfpI family protein [Prevotella sp.]